MLSRQARDATALAAALVVMAAACAPQRAAPADSSSIVRQDTLAASSYSGTDGSASSDPGRSTADRPSSDKTLVIGIAAEVRGFSLMNNLQNKYVEDFVHGNLFLQDEQGRWFPALAAATPRVDPG